MYMGERPPIFANQAPQHQDLGFITAAAAIISMAATGAKLFGGKLHYSPWNFLYDEYPRKIYEAEAALRSMRGESLPPDPGGGAKPTGGAEYQASMLDIVPRYVPGSEPLIASYDRKLNEANGAYEITYGKILQALQSAQGMSPSGPLVPAQHATSAKPASYPSSTAAAPKLTPPSQYGLTDGYGRPIDQYGNLIDPRTGQPIQQQRASMLDNMGDIAPYLIGAVGLIVILATQNKSSGNGSSKRKR